MTATVLGMLVDEGKLNWDQPLREYLPTFKLSDPIVSARITPRDLLTHRSGLPRHDLVWYSNNEATRAELVERLAHLELSADLRERFQYNNLMFMTAGYLAGQLCGKTWEEVMRERLFESLGMELTYNEITSPLEHWHYDVWNAPETDGDRTFEDRKFLFRGDVDGNIAAVESTFEPQAAPIVFSKRPDDRLSDPEFLRYLTGTYETVDGTKLVIELVGAGLTATLPGAPTLTLEPGISGRFIVREYRVISFEFVVDEGEEARKVLMHQPGSIWEAERVD